MDEEKTDVAGVAAEGEGRGDGVEVKAAAAQMDQRAADDALYVVGIGASAGGLMALQRFFDGMPPDSGVAFVVVTHLSPEHVSHMPNLIQPHTGMPVAEVRDTVHMEANHVYVIPPNRYLSAIDTHLRLSDTNGVQRPTAPIDHFFRTLAEAKGERAIGIVLSGTGTDGSVGITRIKERGGLTIVQEPEEAEFDGMPQSALATGLVDVALAVGDMPLRLAQFVQATPQLPVTADGEPATESVQEIMQKIMAQLRAHTGHDFSRYKSSTLTRRIRRRMQIQHSAELMDYLHLLRSNREEVQALFKDLLITVTNFFRDREAFQFLEGAVMPRVMAGKTIGDQVRVWSVGCATGEEAYSLAMVLLEQTDQMDYPPGIQIFASDISEDALARAREGLYPDAIAADVSAERLRRFFHKEPGGFRVKKEVRECVLFAPHNLIKDPPFSRIDLISCRNLLIYLKRDAQRQVFELFHYSLRPDGYLFLGPSEAIEGAELFREVNKRHSVFQAVATAETHLPTMPLTLPGRAVHASSLPERKEATSPGNVHRRMLEQYAAPSILVNADYNIVHLSEAAGRYLQQPGGEPTNNVLRRVLAPFRVELTTMLYGAFKKDKAARAEAVRLMVDGQPCRVTMLVFPAQEAELEGFALIVFEEQVEPSMSKEPPVSHQAENTTIQALEEELEQTRRRLQTTIEEFETSKEEMKAANEELQSINEELRSTAEELETSKEELQSMNEELLTLNQENKNKVEELSQLTGDLQNLLSGTDIATLFLDRELRIKRFTPRVGELFNIMTSDRGRPLAHLTHKLGRADLLEDANMVLRRLVPLEREVQSEEGAWYLTRFLPYRTIEDRIDGVVITFVTITELKRAQDEGQRRAQQQAGVALLGRLALEGMALDALYERATQQVRETLNVAFAELVEVRGEGEGWRVVAGNNGEKGQGNGSKLDNRSAVLYAVQTGEPVLVEDWEGEKRFRLRPYWVDERIRSSGMVRMPGTRPPYGVLAVHATERRTFHEDDVSFLQAVANLLGEATERKAFEERLQRLNETLEERVEERTAQVRALASELLFTEQQVRQRVSQVLHDDLQQVLFATQVHVQFVQQALAADGERPGRVEADEVKGMIDEALQLTRRLTIDLSPPVLRSEDLSEALQWLVGHFKEMHGLVVALSVESLPEGTSGEMRLLIFQMIKELLFNVVKHAGVKEAEVRLWGDGDRLLMQVVDGGNGFSVEKALTDGVREGSYGLGNMRERLGLFGGRMEIESKRGKGTTVTVVIPQGRE